jgi:DNA-binding MarR family transcriptional regulator
MRAEGRIQAKQLTDRDKQVLFLLDRKSPRYASNRTRGQSIAFQTAWRLSEMSLVVLEWAPFARRTSVSLTDRGRRMVKQLLRTPDVEVDA